jgi:hypothetical protein
MLYKFLIALDCVETTIRFKSRKAWLLTPLAGLQGL